jgi:hypothetical protein
VNVIRSNFCGAPKLAIDVIVFSATLVGSTWDRSSFKNNFVTVNFHNCDISTFVNSYICVNKTLTIFLIFKKMVSYAIQSKHFIYSIVNAATGFCVFLKVCYYERFSNRTWIECSSKGERSHTKNWVLCLKNIAD